MNGRINLQALDALRGVLALYVVAGHARWLLWQGHAGWVASAPHAWWEDVIAHASRTLGFGREAVMVFFVLSGFFIHLRSAGELAQKGVIEGFSPKAYAVRRAHRLLPPYAMALVLTLALDTLGNYGWPSLYQAATGDTALDVEFVRKGYSWSSVLPALLVLPSSMAQDFGTNGPLWSLAFEALFYAFYPLWLWVRCRGVWSGFLLAPLFCLLGAVPGVPSFLGSVSTEYVVWLGGAALAEVTTRATVSRTQRWLAVVAVVTGFAVHFIRDHAVAHLLGHVAYGMGAVMLVASTTAGWSKWRLVRLFEWLGVRSYSLYIMHFPWLVLVSAWVFDTWGGRPASGWLALTGFVSAIVFGCGCFALCEKHFLHDRLRLPGGLSA